MIHGRAPEETVLDLPPVVPAEPASRKPPTLLRQAAMPNRAAAEDASPMAAPECRLRHRLPSRPTQGTSPALAGTVAITRAIGPTSLGRRERPVRAARR